MSCSNCYNGCAEIVSDKCVKYTGVDIPSLGIKNGDTLLHVEEKITTYLVSVLDGSGVKITIEKSIICEIVKKYLPTCGDLTVVDFIKALIKAVCELKTLVDGTITNLTTINNFIASLEAAYDVDCLNGVTSTSGTHDILQAVIDRLCAFIIDVDATYVKLADLNSLIAAYLSTTTAATKFYTRMVPFMATPFFPTPAILAKFNNGVGQDEWEKIYLCNGANGTPDMRGRVPVGVTDGTMGGGTLPATVAPGGLNPNYVALPTISYVGSNSVTLSKFEIPTHNHTGSNIVVELNDPMHGHKVGTTGNQSGVNPFKSLQRADDNYDPYILGAGPGPVIEPSSTGITVSKQQLTIVPEGGNEAHTNVQPGTSCYYIIYIP